MWKNVLVHTCTLFPEAKIANLAGSALSQTHAGIVGSKPVCYMNVFPRSLYCLIMTEAFQSTEPLTLGLSDHLLCNLPT
jgi:hypothetical protein